MQDELAPASRAEIPDVRCSDCLRIQADEFGVVRRCALRGEDVEAPTTSLCASHSALGGGRDRGPLGALMVVRNGSLEDLSEPRLSAASVNAAMDVLESCEAWSPDELSFRERVALDLARRSGDRRFNVYVDRLEIRFAAPPRKPLAERYGGAEFASDARGADYLASFTLPGRILMFAALVLGVAASAGVFWFQIELGFSHLWILAAPGALVFAVVLLAGKAFLRSRGIPLRDIDRDRKAD